MTDKELLAQEEAARKKRAKGARYEVNRTYGPDKYGGSNASKKMRTTAKMSKTPTEDKLARMEAEGRDLYSPSTGSGSTYTPAVSSTGTKPRTTYTPSASSGNDLYKNALFSALPDDVRAQTEAAADSYRKRRAEEKASRDKWYSNKARQTEYADALDRATRSAVAQTAPGDVYTPAFGTEANARAEGWAKREKAYNLRNKIDKLGYLSNRDKEDYQTATAGFNAESLRDSGASSRVRYALDENARATLDDWYLQQSGNLSDAESPFANLQYLSETERNDLRYFASRGDWDGAEKYLDFLAPTLNKRLQEQQTKATYATAHDDPLAGVIGNVTAARGAGLALAPTIEGAYNEMRGVYKPVDTNSRLFRAAHALNDTTQGVGDRAFEAAGGGSAGEVARFFAETGLSIAQFASLLPLGQTAPLAFMGAQAAGQTALDTLENGGTSTQALQLAVAAGIIESGSEKIGLDNLFKIAKRGKAGLRMLLRDVGMQSGIEGSEEVVAEVANNLADQLIMGENSQYNKLVNALIANGMDEQQAKGEALFQLYFVNTAKAFAGGALSGAAMGAGAVGANVYYTQQLEEVANELLKEDGVTPERIVRAAQMSGEKDAQPLAQELAAKLALGEEIAPADIGKLHLLSNRYVTSQQFADAEARLKAEEEARAKAAPTTKTETSPTKSAAQESQSQPAAAQNVTKPQNAEDNVAAKATNNTESIESTAGQANGRYAPKTMGVYAWDGELSAKLTPEEQAAIKRTNAQPYQSDRKGNRALITWADEHGDVAEHWFSAGDIYFAGPTAWVQGGRGFNVGYDEIGKKVSQKELKALRRTPTTPSIVGVDIGDEGGVAYVEWRDENGNTVAKANFSTFDLGISSEWAKENFEWAEGDGSVGIPKEKPSSQAQPSAAQTATGNTATKTASPIKGERTAVETAPEETASRQAETEAKPPEVKSVSGEKIKRLAAQKAKPGLTGNPQVLSKGDRKMFDLLAKAVGVEIHFVDSIPASNGRVANGEYVNGHVFISRTAKNPYHQVLAHEITHHFERTAPEKYKALLEEAITIRSEAEENPVEQYMKDLGLSRPAAEHEVVADFAQLLLYDTKSIKKLLANNADVGVTFWRMMNATFWRLEDKFVEAVAGENYRNFKRVIDNARDLWEGCLLDAGELPAMNEASAEAAEVNEDAAGQFSLVTDKDTLDWLKGQKLMKVYRTMQVIDGEIYPPMAAKVKGEDGKKRLVEAIKMRSWYRSDEGLLKPDKNGDVVLDKGNGKTITAAYNPYWHVSGKMIYDQFTSAYKRPNLVVVEGYIPVSELTSGYRAEGAKDPVGKVDWNSGVVASKLKGDKARDVYLSRWFRPSRIVPDSEVAAHIAGLLEGENFGIPSNVVTPSLLEELKKIGVPIEESLQLVETAYRDAIDNGDIDIALKIAKEEAAKVGQKAPTEIEYKQTKNGQRPLKLAEMYPELKNVYSKAKKKTPKKNAKVSKPTAKQAQLPKAIARQQEKRDAGEMLTEAGFNRLYSVHKLDFVKRWEKEEQKSIEATVRELFESGFKGGFGAINLLPVRSVTVSKFIGVGQYENLKKMEEEGRLSKGTAEKYRANLGEEYGKPAFDDVIMKEFAPRKGDTLLLVPEAYVVGGAKVAQGFKPLPYEVLRVTQDYQRPYDLYKAAYQKAEAATNAPQYSVNRSPKTFERDTMPKSPSSDPVELSRQLAQMAADTADEPQYSISSLFSAANLIVKMLGEEAPEHDEDGKLIITDQNGKRVNRVTTKMLNNSGLGAMINFALATNRITAAQARKQKRGLVKLLNMILKAQDAELVWRCAGAVLASAVKSNSDNQYNTTIDFTTVCNKTIEMIRSMSKSMVDLERGLSKDEIVELQGDLVNQNGIVNCPVCYVFSRWAGIGGLLDNMAKWQKKYADSKIWTPEALEKRIQELRTASESKDALRNYLKKYDNEYMEYDHQLETTEESIEDAKAQIKKLKGDKSALEKEVKDAEKKRGQKKTTEEEKAALDERITNAKKEIASVEKSIAALTKTKEDLTYIKESIKKEIADLEKLGNPEAAWLERVRTQPGYKPVPHKILFNLEDSATMIKNYPLAWGYRTSRGPAMGKAILPYSEWNLGDFFLGVGKKEGDLTFADIQDGKFTETQRKKIEATIGRVMAQNLIGGQRFQSTSDFRYDYALDYLMSFLELQAVGSNIQTYTKVIEYAEILASIGGDVNLSVMPLNSGLDENGNLIYSDVTGINYEAAKEMSERYDNAQLILVGINDAHINAALRDDDDHGGRFVGFVIPYHPSGASRDFIAGLLKNLSETFDAKFYMNYEPVQGDHEIKIPFENDTEDDEDIAEEDKDDARKARDAAKKAQIATWMDALYENPENPDFGENKPTAEQENALHGRYLRDIRKFILTEKDTGKSSQGKEALKTALPLLVQMKMDSTDISRKSFNQLREIEKKALAGDPKAIKEYKSWGAGVLYDVYNKMWEDKNASTTYGVRLDGKQSKSIMPHEYWNTSVKRNRAYVNGFIFRSYCYNLGLLPRFTGYKSNGKKARTSDGIEYGDFSDNPGYYKTLIDRPMYDNKGNYRAQTPINATWLSNPQEQLHPSYGEKQWWGKYTTNEPTDERMARAERAALQFESVKKAEEGVLADQLFSIQGQDAGLRKLSERYMVAVEHGDMETAQRLVDKAAKLAGYDTKLYHGTNKSFNVFKATGAKTEAKSARLAVWLSDSLKTATAYSTPQETDFSNAADFDEISRKADALMEKLNSAFKPGWTVSQDYWNLEAMGKAFKKYYPEVYRELTDAGVFIKGEKHVPLTRETYAASKENLDVWKDVRTRTFKLVEWYSNLFDRMPNSTSAFLGLREMLDMAIVRSLAFGENAPKIMHVYVNTNNFAVAQPPFQQDEQKVTKIRSALRRGKAGIVFNGMRDGGEKSTHYAVFDPRLIKSADPVTYDDNGEVIPLTERFNAAVDDIRFSIQGQDERMMDAFRLMAKQAILKDVLYNTAKVARWRAERANKANTDAKTNLRPISAVLADISDFMQMQITTGHMRYWRNMNGFFNPRNAGIRIRNANNLSTAIHELGHAIDHRYGIAKLVEANETLKREALKAFSAFPESVQKQYKPEDHVSEGLAEYMRLFLSDRQTTEEEFPELTKLVLGKLSPRDLAVLDQIADEVNAIMLNTDTAGNAIRFAGEETKLEKAKRLYDAGILRDVAGDRIRNWWNKKYQSCVDSNHAIKRFDRDTGSSVYRFATNAAYSDARAKALIERHLYDFNGNYIGPGLADCLRGVDIADRDTYRAFGEYLVVKHGPERLAEEMDVFSDPRKNNAEWMKKREATLAKEHPEFVEAAEKLYQFQRDFLKAWGVRTNLVSAETAKEWGERWQYYVPFQRYMGDQFYNTSAKRGFANQNSPYNKARGSTRDIIHPVDSIINNIIRNVNVSVRNDVFLRIAQYVERKGANALWLEKIPPKLAMRTFNLAPVKEAAIEQLWDIMPGDVAKIGETAINMLDDLLVQYGRGKAFGNVVTVLRNGKPEFYQINDPLLLDSLTNLAPTNMSGILEAYGQISRFMTANLTGLNVVWSIFSNLPRDIVTARLFAKHHGWGKLIKGMAEAYVNKAKGDKADPIYLEWLAMGGEPSGVYSADVNVARKERLNLTKGSNTPAAKKAAAKRNRNPIRWLEFISNAIESGPRYATYKALREEGVDPHTAFYESMDITTNFRKSGQTGRQINKVVPFFNAGVQGLDKFFRWLSADDAPKDKRLKTVRSRVLMWFAVSAAVAALSYALNHADDEREKDYEKLLSSYTKNNFFIIPIGNHKFFAIPKPREIAVLSTLFERILGATIGGNKKAFYDFYDYFTDQCLPPLISDLAKIPSQGTDAFLGVTGSMGLLGVGVYIGANRDFLNRPIISQSLEKLDLKAQYNDRTSLLAYWIGQAFKWSPQQVDYFLSQTLGGAWKVNKALFPKDPKNRDLTVGIASSYVKDSLYSTDVADRMYDLAEKSEKHKNTYPDDIDAAINYKMDKAMLDYYKAYYGLEKGVKDTTKDKADVEALTEARRAVLVTVSDYLDAAEDDGAVSVMPSYIYEAVKEADDTSLLPDAMKSKVKDADKNEVVLTPQQYVEYQGDYLRRYYELAEKRLPSASDKAETLKDIKKQAKEDATAAILSKAK